MNEQHCAPLRKCERKLRAVSELKKYGDAFRLNMQEWKTKHSATVMCYLLLQIAQPQIWRQLGLIN
ncbi:hypothetical protein Lal_00030843 [Lupinus albus]|nr:hypothetical protein Lal_00030843 [Lupinus albus]